jgi:hypothetical protein
MGLSLVVVLRMPDAKTNAHGCGEVKPQKPSNRIKNHHYPGAKTCIYGSQCDDW